MGENYITSWEIFIYSMNSSSEEKREKYERGEGGVRILFPYYYRICSDLFFRCSLSKKEKQSSMNQKKTFEKVRYLLYYYLLLSHDYNGNFGALALYFHSSSSQIYFVKKNEWYMLIVVVIRLST